MKHVRRARVGICVLAHPEPRCKGVVLARVFFNGRELTSPDSRRCPGAPWTFYACELRQWNFGARGPCAGWSDAHPHHWLAEAFDPSPPPSWCALGYPAGRRCEPALPWRARAA